MISPSTTTRPGENDLKKFQNLQADWQFPWRSSDHDQPEIRLTTSNRLRDETSEGFDRLSAVVKTIDPLSCRENYFFFLSLQLDFHHHTEPLYTDPVIRQLALGVTDTGRAECIRLDMKELGMSDDTDLSSRFSLPGGLIQRLGWLYVAESLYRGCALFLPAARRLNLYEKFGASHFTKHPDETAQQWQALKDRLDELQISELEAERLHSGARSALAFAFKQLSAACAPNSTRRWSPLSRVD